MRIIDNLKQIPVKIYILNSIAAYLLTCAVVMLTRDIAFYDIASISQIPIAEFILSIILLFAMMMVLEALFEIKGMPVFISAVFYCLIAIYTKTSDVYFTVSCIVAFGILTYYLLREDLINFQWHISEKNVGGTNYCRICRHRRIDCLCLCSAISQLQLIYIRFWYLCADV